MVFPVEQPVIEPVGLSLGASDEVDVQIKMKME